MKDVRKLVPRTPPEGLLEWAAERHKELDQDGLLIETEWAQDWSLEVMLDEWAENRKVRAIRATCSACKESGLLWRGRDGRGEWGFIHPGTWTEGEGGEVCADGDKTTCPWCGESVIVRRKADVRKKGWFVAAERHVMSASVLGKDRLLTLTGWTVQRRITAAAGRQLVAIPAEAYLETPPEWLGPRFIADAEHLKALRPMAYRNEYLGEVTGGGANVFENIQLRAITDEELGRFDRIYRGIDWGYYPDPWAYNCMHYDAARLTLYIFDEAEAYRKGNEETARILREEKGVQPLDLLTADSAEPKSIGDYKAFGLYCRGAAKPPGSVEYSMKWLGRLAAIVIDPERCPRTAKEFSEYEFERDKDGNLISAYPDAKNHHIDAVRYGMQPVWKQRGE